MSKKTGEIFIIDANDLTNQNYRFTHENMSILPNTQGYHDIKPMFTKEELELRQKDHDFVKQYLNTNNLVGQDRHKIKKFLSEHAKSFYIYFYSKNLPLTQEYRPNRLRIWYSPLNDKITKQPTIG